MGGFHEETESRKGEPFEGGAVLKDGLVFHAGLLMAQAEEAAVGREPNLHSLHADAFLR